MNILFVTACYPSAQRPHYCIYLEQQAAALQSLGHRVDILLLRHKEPVSDPADYLQNGLQVHELELPDAPIEKFFTGSATKGALAAFPWQNYQVISMHLLKVTHASTVAQLCRQKGVPTLMHFHGLNVWKEYAPGKGLKHRLMDTLRTWQRKQLLRRCTAVVGVSNRVCDAVKQKAPKAKTYRVYNGVDLKRFYPGEPEPGFRVVCVANLIPLKGQRDLLDAMAMLTHRQLSLLIIGEGPDREVLEQDARQRQLNVTFRGALDYDEMAACLRTSRMFVMPSRYEAFGCVFVEAMASGLLTCGCADTGADEIIDHEKNGLLLPMKDPKAIARAIERAMDDPAWARNLAQQGCRRAAGFSWEQSARALETVYLDVLK